MLSFLNCTIPGGARKRTHSNTHRELNNTIPAKRRLPRDSEALPSIPRSRRKGPSLRLTHLLGGGQSSSFHLVITFQCSTLVHKASLSRWINDLKRAFMANKRVCSVKRRASSYPYRSTAIPAPTSVTQVKIAQEDKS